MIRKIIAVLLVVETLSQVSPPVWPPIFKQSFVEFYNDTPTKAAGTFYYDQTRQAMRIDRTDGQSDMICGSILPKVNTYCTQLIRDKKRYIIFPMKRQCCMCCDADHGCGILKRDWLSTAKYQGQQTISGQSYYKWSIPDGQQTDYYYSTKSAQRIPKRIDTGPGVSVQDFIISSYSTQIISEQIFALPNYCKSSCPPTTVCGKFQSGSIVETE